MVLEKREKVIKRRLAILINPSVGGDSSLIREIAVSQILTTGTADSRWTPTTQPAGLGSLFYEPDKTARCDSR